MGNPCNNYLRTICCVAWDYPCNKSPEFRLNSCMGNPYNNYLRTISCMGLPMQQVSKKFSLNSCMGNPCNKFGGLFENYLLHETTHTTSTEFLNSAFSVYI